MKTNELIAALSADPVPGPSPMARLMRGLAPALILPLAALVLLWQLRPDLTTALTSPALAKTLVPALFAGVAIWLCSSLSKPEADRKLSRQIVLTVLAVSVALLVWQILELGLSGLWQAIDTPNTLTCLLSVPVLSLLPLGLSLWAMRAGATGTPRWSGALAGVFAGAAGASIYSLHCPEDTLVFFLTIYTAPILVVTAIGAVIGSHTLRW